MLVPITGLKKCDPKGKLLIVSQHCQQSWDCKVAFKQSCVNVDNKQYLSLLRSIIKAQEAKSTQEQHVKLWSKFHQQNSNPKGNNNPDTHNQWHNVV